MVRHHLSRFEALARRAVEGSMGRLIGDDELTIRIAARLAEALDRHQQQPELPRTFRVFLNPADWKDMDARIPQLEEWLAGNLSALSSETGVVKRKGVAVRVVADVTIQRGDVALEALYESETGNTTNVFERGPEIGIEALRLLDAFLIVNGRRHVALDGPFITIGRRIDNDVIIDSPVVSRRHAHIRWKHGRFVLYDIGSRGGIHVNGKKITECVLAPGDLITLSERVPIIYGEGLEHRPVVRPEDRDTHDTLAYTPEED